MSKQNINEIETRFNTIYDETYLTVLKFISSRCRHADYVPDIIQETYLELFKTLRNKKSDYIKDSTAFVMNLAKRKLSRHYTLAERLKQFLPLHKDDDETDPIDEIGGFEFEDDLIDELMLNDVWRIILCTDEQTRQIFHMRYIQNDSLDTIANNLCIPLHTVRNKLYRTLEEIKRHFEKGEPR